MKIGRPLRSVSRNSGSVGSITAGSTIPSASSSPRLRALRGPLDDLAPHWTSGLRTGDTASGERAAQSRRLPTVLVTTPESLSLLLARADAREALQPVQLVVADQPRTQGMVKAVWSNDDNLTAQINNEVAHYTGQTELAAAIQEGLAAKQAGDLSTATSKLGRAVQLATETGNREATTKLRKVVDVVDPGSGTVRLKRNVSKADEMALDTSSTKTTRTRQSNAEQPEE